MFTRPVRSKLATLRTGAQTYDIIFRSFGPPTRCPPNSADISGVRGDGVGLVSITRPRASPGAKGTEITQPLPGRGPDALNTGRMRLCRPV